MNLDYVFIRHQFTLAAMLPLLHLLLFVYVKVHSSIVINIICRLTCIYTYQFMD